MTYPSPLPPLMAVEANHLHLLAPQFLMDRKLIAGVTEASKNNTIGTKRPRESLSFIGEAVQSSDLQQYLINQRSIFLHRTRDMAAELTERRKRFSRLLIAAVMNEAGKRVKAKEDELDAAMKMNHSLEERFRTLCIENQTWKDLAQTSEVTANLLTANLEHIIASQISVKEDRRDQFGDYLEIAGDAESCCCGNNEGSVMAEMRALKGFRVCRGCGGGEATVLLFPCRHLCLCFFCSPAITFCPICNSAISGSVNVNLP